jgi:DNA-binding SARP family transcriptional activator
LEYGRRILRCDRAHESTHQQMMRLYYLAGDRAAALRQYERCAAALHEELDVLPARRTVALYEQIRADRLEESAPVSPPAPPVQTQSAAEPSGILRCLRKTHAALSEAQREIEENIQRVERAVHGKN